MGKVFAFRVIGPVGKDYLLYILVPCQSPSMFYLSIYNECQKCDDYGFWFGGGVSASPVASALPSLRRLRAPSFSFSHLRWAFSKSALTFVFSIVKRRTSDSNSLILPSCCCCETLGRSCRCACLSCAILFFKNSDDCNAVYHINTLRKGWLTS